jgi:hypothetical protein
LEKTDEKEGEMKEKRDYGIQIKAIDVCLLAVSDEKEKSSGF